MIRPATYEDTQSITHIYNHYVENTTVTFEEQVVKRSDMQTRITAITNLGLPWLVYEKASKVIGYAYASQWNTRSAYRNTIEVTIYLSPHCVGKGLGTALYQALFTQLKDDGYHTAIAGITLPNPASINLHEKLGLRKVGHFKQVGYKFGRWLDVGYWQSNLKG
jgi:phosphinothricin acetyltransferase